LTGNENFTHRLGIESFKIFSGREEEAEGGYAHSGAFSMVDPNGYLRGVYNITGFDGSVNKKEYRRLKEELGILIESLK
jgi:protein SCO1/2